MKVSISKRIDLRATPQVAYLQEALSPGGLDAPYTVSASGADAEAYWTAYPQGLVLWPGTEPLPPASEPLACLRRRGYRDVLVALAEDVHLENFSRRIGVGVPSARAACLLAYYVPQATAMRFDQEEASGDWIAGLRTGLWDAVLVSAAEAEGQGMKAQVVQRLNPMTFLPSPGEGIWWVLGQAGQPRSPHTAAGLARLHHPPSAEAWQCEQAYQAALPPEAIPMALATVQQGQLTLAAGLVFVQGQAPRRYTATGLASEAAALGQAVAHHLMAMTDTTA